MIFKKPDVIIKLPWNKDKPEVYILDSWGLSKSDKVVIPMRSGRNALCSIISYVPIHKEINGIVTQARTYDQSFVWKAVIKPEKYV